MKFKTLKEAILENEWLSGRVDIEEGDLFAGLERAETFTSDPYEVRNARELWRILSDGEEGVFLYKNLAFANSYHYGCFVFKKTANGWEWFEHLTIDAFDEREFMRFLEENVE